MFIVPELLPVPPTEGGAVEHWVHEVSQKLADLGLRVAVISRPAHDMDGQPKIAYLGVPWTRVARLLLKIKQTCSRRNPLRSFAKVANVLGYALGVRRLVRLLNPDIIYVHNDPLLVLLIRKHAGQRLVLHMHNDHLAALLLTPILNAVLEKTDQVLCVSEHIRRSACDAAPKHALKLATVLNATDPDFFKHYPNDEASQPGRRNHGDAEAFHFLYVGRLTQDKGAHVLIDAFTTVQSRFPQARLVITGSSFFADAPSTDYQRRLAMQAVALTDAIVFTGFVPHDRLRYLYSDADAVVVPSIWQEPFGLVVIEAMSSETCVIATRVGGIPEVISHEETGLLVDPNDAQALVTAMTRVLLDAELRKRLASAARQDVLRRFSYQRLSNDIATSLTQRV
ncbi:MAG: glycosyltransferase family 4 protein [Burkholderiaceae bacterium]|nr:glycosyltransferase family 4 protein [Burkholderiaceae bacterium]